MWRAFRPRVRAYRSRRPGSLVERVRDLIKRRHDNPGRSTCWQPLQCIQRRMNNALTYLHTRWDECLSLRQLAQRTGMAPAHFCRRSTQACGLSPHRYHAVPRITRANSILIAGVKVSDAPFSAGLVTAHPNNGNSL
jgi:transcriptional regulator GlxA family with amidase domain